MQQGADRRAYERKAIEKQARFSVNGGAEASALLTDISKGGLFMMTDAEANIGDKVVIYPDELGRLEGTIVSKRSGGVGVEFAISDSYREFLDKRIKAALAGGSYLRLADRRSNLRSALNIEAPVRMVANGECFICRIDNISEGGAAISSSQRPYVGAQIRVGSIPGKVLRHTENGFTVQFLQQKAA